MKYFDEKKQIIFVGAGISGTMGNSRYYASYREKTDFSSSRIKTKFLPIREAKEEAEKDLAAYALKKGWQPIEESTEPGLTLMADHNCPSSGICPVCGRDCGEDLSDENECARRGEI